MTTTLPRLLSRSAAAFPGRTAVEDPQNGDWCTYAELEGGADAVCNALTRHGVLPGDRVGILAPKSIGVVTSVFGILKARAAYVPVDATAPPARGAGIFEDCATRAIVADSSLVDGLRAAWPQRPLRLLADLGNDLVLLSGADPAPTAAAVEEEPAVDEVAYILYTSGSTGKPKGVVHTHASALAFVDWCSEVFGPTGHDRFSSHAPFHFDLSIFDIYVSIKHGATLVLFGEDLGKQPQRLAATIAGRRISIWYSTPSILRLLVDYGRLEQFEFPALRLVLFAGEVFPLKHLRSLKAIWTRPAYFNLYGPTETNVCTYYEVPTDIPEDRTEPFPIGWACSGDRLLIVDEGDTPVAPGEAGELYVHGPSVMRDYWNLPDRTAGAFFIDDEGHRWYRTGDIVRDTPDEGCIFLGRRDRMVKRRGYRVELGEIEAALYRNPQVVEAAVVAIPDETHGVLIHACLTMAYGVRPSLIEMKGFCAAQLPMYMIPDRFTYHDALPKTSTDKIDYQRLVQIA